MTDSRPPLVTLILHAVVASLLFVLGTVLFGMFASALHIQMPVFDTGGVSQTKQFLLLLLSSLFLGFGLLPLARRLAGGYLARFFALALFLFLAFAVNTVIEATIFTKNISRAGALHLACSFLLPTILSTFYLARFAEPALGPAAISDFFSRRSFASWLWRLPLAVLAFPFIYFLFGMIIAPIVTPYYNSGIAGLVIPAPQIILATQVFRGLLFLLAVLPVLILSRRSRPSLFFWLGLALWFVVGLFGLASNAVFPPVLRVVHSLEIGADSFTHAAVLVFLLVPRPAQLTTSRAAQGAQQLPA